MTLIRHTLYMTLRHLRELWRQPWFVAVTLVQPVIWLLLFGALFKKVIEIPGFHSHSYIAFLAPGVVVMTAMFNAAWSGMSLIDDMRRGVTARFLVSPVRREALIAGRILKEAVVVVIQSLIIVALALVVGASFPGGIGGVALLFVLSALLGAMFGALSNGFALIMGQEEALIGAGVVQRRLGADRRARRVPGGAAGAVRGVRDQGVPELSAVCLILGC
jgi:ABC-2 type transport system permease protein